MAHRPVINDTTRFRRIMNNAVAIPLVVMVALAALLISQVLTLLSAASLVEHTDEVLGQTNNALKLLVDQETGVRGYLVAGNTLFLEPYNTSRQQMDKALGDIKELVKDNPLQTARFGEIQAGYVRWSEEAKEEMQRFAENKAYRNYFNQARGKRLMDAQRARFNEFIETETRYRHDRNARSHTLAQLTLATTGGVTVIAGAGLAFVTRRRLQELALTFGEALSSERAARVTIEAARRETEEKAAEVALLNAELEKRVADRTAELSATNRELEAFSYSVSHDLRAPLRSIDGFSVALLEDYGEEFDTVGKGYLTRIRANSQIMAGLIDGLLNLSRLTRSEMTREDVDLSAMAWEVINQLQMANPERKVEVVVAPNIHASGDSRLLRNVMENLIGNAWKFSSQKPEAHITFGTETADNETVYFVRDNGAGFDMKYIDKLFGAFQRLHGTNEFEGTGIGLATVQRVVRRHGGRIWAEGSVGEGATFYFTLG